MNRPKNNPKNDRVKRDYLIWLKDAHQRSDATVDQARHAIDRLEVYTGYKDFGTFNKEQARAFKQALLATKAQRSGKPISIQTVYHVLQALKDFLAWLHEKPGYSRRIALSDIAFLNLTLGEESQAHATGLKKYASLEEYRKAIFAMPTGTEIERRDQAIMALLLLTCMRDAAAISLKLKHINIKHGYVFQDSRQVKTKFRKTIPTTFYPVGDDIEAIIRGWVQFLITEKGFGPDDPLFPKTVNGHDEHHNFVPVGLGREHWANAKPVRDIFRETFDRVELPYVKPHSIRDTLTQLGHDLNLTPTQWAAWSINMGHETLLTTVLNYAPMTTERQAGIMRSLRHEKPNVGPDDAMAAKIAEKVAAMLGNVDMRKNYGD